MCAIQKTALFNTLIITVAEHTKPTPNRHKNANENSMKKNCTTAARYFRKNNDI